MSSKKAVKQTDAELASFANNSHETEYTRMMHRYADLDKREKTLRRKQCFANWMLFVSVVLVIGCVIATAFVCTTIKSIGL
nr:MAG TPA: nonstructural protein [Bacteriophage sp.]